MNVDNAWSRKLGVDGLWLATIQNAPGAVHTQEFSDIKTCLACGVEWPGAGDFFVTG
jgi:hypothetical protein